MSLKDISVYDDSTAQRYILAPYVRAGFEGNVLFLGFGSLQQKITDAEQQAVLLEAAKFWKELHSLDVVRQHLKNQGFVDQVTDWVLELLQTKHFLLNERTYEEYQRSRYSRNLLYLGLYNNFPETVLMKLKKCSVILLGCGSIGNFVAYGLAAAGVGRLYLVDKDQVELSNLTRQIFFTEDDVGEEKSHVLAREVGTRNRETIVTPIPMFVDRSSDLEALPHADLLVLSADKPGEIVYWVNTYCVHKRMPYINAGYVEDVAVWGPFVKPGETGCWRCQSLVATADHAESRLQEAVQAINKGYQAPSNAAVTMIAAAGVLLDAVRFLGGYGVIQSLNKRIGIWTHSLRIEMQDVPRNPACPVCGDLCLVG